MVADDAVKIWADAVGTALLEGMAGGAFLRRRSPLLDRCGLQKFLDRLGRSRRGFLAAAWCCFLHCDLVTRLFRHLGGENCTGREARHQENKAGAENRTENFIEFEGVHFGSGSRPEMSTLGRREAAADASGIRLSHRTPSHVEISVCPCSGNPYKCANFRPIPIISGLLSTGSRPHCP